jgi:hypothetical protein
VDALLNLLTFKVRAAAAAQLAGIASETTLRRLVRDNLLARHRVLVRWPLPDLSGGPLARHKPGDPPVDPEHLSYLARRRWSMPTRVVTAYVATPAAARRTGGIANGRVRQPLQCTHDMCLLECFNRQAEDVRGRWWGEDVIKATGWDSEAKIPDAIAFAFDRPGLADVAIEFAGSYSAARIAEFARANHERRYELW